MAFISESLAVAVARRRNASAFGNGSRFLSASIFEHLPHRVPRKWFLSAAKGVQSNNKWHAGWDWGGRGWGKGRGEMRERLLSADCALATNNTMISKPVLNYFFVLVKSSNSVWWWGWWSACVCTSFGSQRRAVLQWKQKLKLFFQPCMSVLNLEMSKYCVSLNLSIPTAAQHSRAFCYYQQRVSYSWVSAFCQSHTVSNTDKVAQKLC